MIETNDHYIFYSYEPCYHPGCLNNILHPCEYCGRIAGHGVVKINKNIFNEILEAKEAK